MSPAQLHLSVQPGAPVIEPAERTVDLAAAVQVIFPMDTDDAILNWNRVPIRLSYRYDVSVLVDDLLPLIAALTADAGGERRVEWGSDTFRGRWDLRWKEDELHVAARWDSVSGDYEDLLNSRPEVTLSRGTFVAEWARLLATVMRGVDASGVRIDRTDQIGELRRLVLATDSSETLTAPCGRVGPGRADHPQDTQPAEGDG